MKTAVGVACFPNDGIDKKKTDALFYELLENITNFNNLGYNIILMGDFNGRCVDVCPHTGKTILKTVSLYNGERLLRFIDASDLTILNTLGCCSGLFTRILNNQRSTIDYIFMSNEMAQNVKSVFIDEEGKYDLHSDHIFRPTLS
jgi:exonuclease III